MVSGMFAFDLSDLSVFEKRAGAISTRILLADVIILAARNRDIFRFPVADRSSILFENTGVSYGNLSDAQLETRKMVSRSGGSGFADRTFVGVDSVWGV